MPATLATIYNTARLTGSANQSSTPIQPGRLVDGSAELGAGRPVILAIDRDPDGATGALDGTLAIKGAMLPDPNSGSPALVQMGLGDGATVIFDTDGTLMTHAPFADNNWIVKINGTIIPQGAGAGKFQVSNPSGSVARITFGTAPAKAARIEIYKVAPVVVLADGRNYGGRFTVNSYDVMWATVTVAAGNFSATNVVLEPR